MLLYFHFVDSYRVRNLWYYVTKNVTEVIYGKTLCYSHEDSKTNFQIYPSFQYNCDASVITTGYRFFSFVQKWNWAPNRNPAGYLMLCDVQVFVYGMFKCFPGF